MNIGKMQYEVKRKLNRLDSQQNRNFKIPVLDNIINEAIEIYIASIAQPRVQNQLGFETSQRSIDDIRTIVIDRKPIQAIKIDSKSFTVSLPSDYQYYISATALISKEGCEDRIARCVSAQHDDRFEESVFDESSFGWKEVDIWFYEGGIKVFTDGTFEVKEVYLNYIRKHKYVHNAVAYLPTKKYISLDGVLLTGSQDCELPEPTHREIVDIAVLLIAMELQLPDIQIKQAKLALNQFS